MSDSSTHLLLPCLLAAQAQKPVTHNEALRLLDGLVQLSVLDRDLTGPLGNPSDGDRHIVASGGAGAWSGWDLNVAYYVDWAWMRLAPRPGWRAWVEDEGMLLVFNGSGWITTAPTELQGLVQIGVGTLADAANPFSAKLNAALWTALSDAEGSNGDLRVTLNWANAADTLALLLQSDYSGRVKLGLAGSDDLTLKVSANGSSWHEALAVDRASGIVREPSRPGFKAYTNYDNYQSGEARGGYAAWLTRRRLSECTARSDRSGRSGRLASADIAPAALRRQKLLLPSTPQSKCQDCEGGGSYPCSLTVSETWTGPSRNC